MVEEVKKEEAEVAPAAAENDAAGAASGDTGTEELYDFPDYGEEFYQTDAFKDLGISDKKITKEQKEKLEALYKKMNEEKEGAKNEGSAGKEGEGDKEKEGEGDSKKKMLNIEENNGQGQENTDENAWIDEYDQKLSTYAAANNNTWERDTAADENGEQPQGLKGRFGNGVEAHYTSKDSLAVQTPKDVAPTADHFKEIVALAKDQEQIINLGSQMRSEFRAALIEACAKGGVEIFNLTSEEREVYNNLVAEQQAKEKTAEGEGKEGGENPEKTAEGEGKEGGENPEKTAEGEGKEGGENPEKTAEGEGKEGGENPEKAAEGEGKEDEGKSGSKNGPKTTQLKKMERAAKTAAKNHELASRGYTELDEQISDLKKKGAEIGKDSKESTLLAMAEYVKMSVADAQGKLDADGKQKMADMKQVLVYYGLEVGKEMVARGKNGKEEEFVAMNRDMKDRTPEEQQSIMEAVSRVQPKKQNIDLSRMSTKEMKDKTGGYVQ